MNLKVSITTLKTMRYCTGNKCNLFRIGVRVLYFEDQQALNKLAAAPTKMERSMLDITCKDRKTNIWVRERTKVIDIINTVRTII